MMGRAKASEMSKKYTVTLATINETIIIYPNFLPAQIEKNRLLMMVSLN